MTSYDFALLLVRLVVGITIFMHGYNHIFGGGKVAGTARWFTSVGLKPGIVHAWASGITEMGAGVAIAVGLFTSVGAAGVVSVMLVAFMTVHRKNGFFIFRPGEGYEYVLNLFAIGFALAILGPGKVSLDRAFKIDDNFDGKTGLLLALILGVGSAVLLLATSWRPVKPEPKA